MNIIDIINKKRLKKELSYEEIEYIVKNYSNNKIKDYQMSSLLMAILLNSMTEEETINLTKCMLESGDKLDLSDIGNVVDKHSTGGVGDKTTLIVAPIVASCGVKVAKMSGKGLGHTGGTIDKLESIPGFKVNMTNDQFENQIKNINVAIVSQTANLAPIDKKIYALRDVTGTVESIPLIASSIMSKKIASGAKNLVLDIKIGSGALIKTRRDAKKLAKLMIKIGQSNKIKVVCLLTNMDVPLGSNVGNALEIEEAIDILTNKKNNTLREICIILATYMVSLGLDISVLKARNMVIDSLKSGKAYNKFLELILSQGGDINKLPKGEKKIDIIASKSGYIKRIDALSIGKLAMNAGAGRMSLEDDIDYSAGVIIHKKINDRVKKGDILASVITNKNIELNDKMFQIVKTKSMKQKIIYEILGE